MASNTLVDITKLSPKFQDLYAKAKDFIEVCDPTLYSLFRGNCDLSSTWANVMHPHRMNVFLLSLFSLHKWVKVINAGR
jgi:hypothetical protein